MQLFIHKLVLWPRDARFDKREIKFEIGKINLVTGQSGSGKSAILHIVDYVLGASKCAIPVGHIRDTVEWYGLVLDLGHTQMIVARKEPGGKAQSGDYFLHTAEEVTVPATVSKSTNHLAFKNRMDKLAGLPSVDFDPLESGNKFLSRPSFRDMAAFNFLPQHIVANPYAMFFKADTNEHRSKLITIMPFIFGALTVRHLAAQHEQSQLRKHLRKLNTEYRQRQGAVDVWKAEAFGLYGRAVELGLVPPDTPEPSTVPQCIALLAAIPSRLQQPEVALPPPGATGQAAVRLQEAREKEQDVTTKLADTRRQIGRIKSLQKSTEGFGEAIATGAERVQGVGWFERKIKDHAMCPICGSTQDTARAKLGELADAATLLAGHQRKVKDVPVALNREHKELLNKATGLDDQLRELRLQRIELEATREASGGQRLDQMYQFAGRIEQSLLNFEITDDDSELRQRISAAEERLAELENLLEPEETRRRLETARRLIGDKITRYASSLDLERSSDLVSLEIKELTLIFESPKSSRRDWLWEIGSGANWMGYHISTMLGLHLHFLSMDRNYVPSFLIIDQPSQVYFPSGIPNDAEDESDDVVSTRKIFEALEMGLHDSKCQLQIIVTEHADERTIQGISTLHKVEDWHRSDTDWLIPQDWIEN